MQGSLSKDIIQLDSGEEVLATFPVIVSASRSTDIPAFYADWFFHRLKKGYSSWRNPFNNRVSYVGYRDTKFVVFWSKNPAPLLPWLDYLKERGISCYIQYSLNDYDAEGLEPNVPPLAERIDTFRRLVDELGKGAVIWRNDPLVLTDRIDVDCLVSKIEKTGEQLKGYTEKLVFSFVDIDCYAKVRGNLSKSGIKWINWKPPRMLEFAKKLVALNKSRGWNFKLAICGEDIDLPDIAHNKCIDGELILRLCPDCQELRDYMGIKPESSQVRQQVSYQPALMGWAQETEKKLLIPKDKGQRPACGCAKSKDIGQYNTCPHGCVYCYANSSRETALQNYKRHRANPDCETITGD